MKILWQSQHAPLQKQLDALLHHFGDVEVHQDENPFSNAEQVLQRFKKGGYQEMVIVAPLSVIAKLCELGLRPLYAIMDQVVHRSEADLVYHGRLYRFNRFVRVKAVKMETEEI